MKYMLNHKKIQYMLKHKEIQFNYISIKIYKIKFLHKKVHSVSSHECYR